jgi:hypothetical protein
MARIDDYVQARKIAIESLAKTDFIQLQQRAGFTQNSSATTMIVPFLNRVFRIECPSFEFIDCEDESKEVPIQEQVLILHYLKAEAFPCLPADGFLTGKYRVQRFITVLF